MRRAEETLKAGMLVRILAADHLHHGDDVALSEVLHMENLKPRKCERVFFASGLLKEDRRRVAAQNDASDQTVVEVGECVSHAPP